MKQTHCACSICLGPSTLPPSRDLGRQMRNSCCLLDPVEYRAVFLAGSLMSSAHIQNTVAG